ncbi:MAG: sulfate ABC transporter permease subunit CysT [Clostridium sp.]|nr:sulfate ABC transporter permease subunit CysT [Clostridium sp.]
MIKAIKKKRVIPGFGISMGVTIAILSIIVLIPIGSLILYSSKISFSEFIDIITEKQILSAFSVSFLCSFIAAIINAIFGVILAWVLIKYDFVGKRFLDGLIELPFALPTAVAGITLTYLYSDKGLIGQIFGYFGIKIAYSKVGIIIAMVFIGIPFVVRTIQPILSKMDKQYEEAAFMLGASKRRTFFKVILPEIMPAVLTGFGLAFARGLGEYGSVVFIAGNIPNETQIVPLLIVNKLEQFKYTSATALALVMLVISFLLLFLINIIQSHIAKKTGN